MIAGSWNNQVWGQTQSQVKPEDALWVELSHLDADHRKISPALKKWIGKPIEIVGWVIPNEFEGGELTEFLLTHYPGGCVHVHMNEAGKKLEPLAATKKVKVLGKLSLGERIDAGFEFNAERAGLFEH